MIDNRKSWRGMLIKLDVSSAYYCYDHISINILRKEKADDNWTIYEFKIKETLIRTYYCVERYVDTDVILK